MTETTTTSAPVRFCRGSSAPCRCPACSRYAGPCEHRTTIGRGGLSACMDCDSVFESPDAQDVPAGGTLGEQSLAEFRHSGAESTPQRQESASDRDPVTRPAHYALSPEPLDVIEAWRMPYHEGNVLKYIARWRQKNGVQDLRKAAEYLRRLIEIADREGW